ncbi:MAG TPA: hypothetical protein VLZ77_12270 [Acidimicrobiales bacterium]|nr:hypothetical protein [Acidimicrobiales bacterium]
MSTSPEPTRWRRLSRAFGHFWVEFLVGDTPELALGGLVAVVLVAALAHNGAGRLVTVTAMPVLVVGALAVSLRRAARSGRRSGG